MATSFSFLFASFGSFKRAIRTATLHLTKTFALANSSGRLKQQTTHSFAHLPICPFAHLICLQKAERRQQLPKGVGTHGVASTRYTQHTLASASSSTSTSGSGSAASSVSAWLGAHFGAHVFAKCLPRHVKNLTDPDPDPDTDASCLLPVCVYVCVLRLQRCDSSRESLGMNSAKQTEIKCRHSAAQSGTHTH